ncbi:pYEATS domain-containing protein [Roseibium sp.]|uniref:pYEATS domain-containing protein n=1 Tax=Roseibium sp. TaxID=1936156 RepID=UPI003BB0BDE6
MSNYSWKIELVSLSDEVKSGFSFPLEDILPFLSSLVWPFFFLLIALIFRKSFKSLFLVALKRFETATEFELGGLKIKGAIVDQSGKIIRGKKGEKSKVFLEEADFEDSNSRREKYLESRDLMLVHTIKPLEPAKYIEDLRVFEVSIYITSHLNNGNLNDIERVKYYLGSRWGRGKYGSKYVVTSSNDCFALTASMYGACLCIAEVFFHDTENPIVLTRYLDVEMAPVYGIPIQRARFGPNL